MNAKGNLIKDSKTKMPESALMRWAGVSVMLLGLCFIVIGMFHPVNVPSSVTTATWFNVHIFAIALGFLGTFGMAGLYARQAEEAGWLGLIGAVLFTGWMILASGFSFVEAFILPRMVTASPEMVEGLLGIFTGVPSQIDFGILPTLSKVGDIMYLVGPVLFGIATFRAGVLPRWAGAMFVIGALLAPIGAIIPPEYQPKMMLPHGLTLIWLGYTLFAERKAKSSEALPDQRNVTSESNQAA